MAFVLNDIDEGGIFLDSLWLYKTDPFYNNLAWFL